MRLADQPQEKRNTKNSARHDLKPLKVSLRMKKMQHAAKWLLIASAEGIERPPRTFTGPTAFDIPNTGGRGRRTCVCRGVSHVPAP